VSRNHCFENSMLVMFLVKILSLIFC